MSQELTFEEKSEQCGTSAMEPGGAPCSFGAPLEPKKRPFFQSVWVPVVAKVVLGGVAILGFAGLGYWSLQHEGRSVLSIAEARAAEDKAHARGNNEWLAGSSADKGKAGQASAVPVQVQPCPAASGASSAAGSTGVASSAPAGAAGTGEGATPGKTADGKVVLNAAEVSDLVKLPGVGPKRAQSILDLRARLGRFRKVTDLLRVKGIGVKGLKKIEPFVVLDAPPAA